MSKVKLGKKDVEALQGIINEYGKDKVLKALVNGFKVKKEKFNKCNTCNGIGYHMGMKECLTCLGKGGFYE